MKSNRSRYAVLGLLARGPGSGYDLKKTVENELSHFWNESYGQIYPILKSLADERLAVRKVERQEGRPDRQVYSITSKGRQALEAWLQEPSSFQVTRNETLLKLFFGAGSPPGVNRELIEKYRSHHVKVISDCEELEQSLRAEAKGREDLSFWLLTVSHCRMNARAAVRWCDQVLREIESLDRRRSRSAKKRRAR